MTKEQKSQYWDVIKNRPDANRAGLEQPIDPTPPFSLYAISALAGGILYAKAVVDSHRR